ncbi:MAG: hypothetical protein RLZ66_1314 [Pseudomonadota bacterium]
MNRPTPAIVTQEAVRRLPRLALLLFCAAYVLPGLIGREPWKSLDMASLGYMLSLARGEGTWTLPSLLGLPPELDGLLPYWLGAFFIHLSSDVVPAFLAVRIPFMGLVVLTMAATWNAVYNLALSAKAQPVAFAFGGEASPKEYARALADAGLLALIATLGLAQPSHEITPMVVQLALLSLAFYGVAALPHHRGRAYTALALSVLGLTLSGAPSLALLLGGSLALLCLWDSELPHRLENALWLSGLCLLSAAISLQADLWQWRIRPPHATWNEWRTLLRLLLWFTWPAWPLALWTLWRWRHQWCNRVMHRHLLLPLWLVALTTTCALVTASAERTLLLALPPLAALAAFALPTLQRSVSAFIDWFTLLFFSGCALVIWVVWVAVQTGWPAQPAANVARLLPGFSPSWGPLAFATALLATLTWVWLVTWRVGRHRAALWKSLVLPAGGAALCWLLLMTLWLPLLDFARSYGPLVRNVNALMGTTACVQVYGMNRAQIAAFQYHGNYQVNRLDASACEWLVIDADALPAFERLPANPDWERVKKVWRPSDNNENVILFKRAPAAPAPHHE